MTQANRRTLIITTLFLTLSTSLQASLFTAEFQLLADDGEPLDFFGRDVAISGDTAAILAESDDDNGQSAGAVYIFERVAAGWIERFKLDASDCGMPGLFFGAPAIDKNTLAVPAGGKVCVFEPWLNGWVHTATLEQDPGPANTSFGIPTAIDGDLIAVAANRDDDGGPDAGAVYLFRRAGGAWTREAKLVVPGTRSLGFSLAVGGDAVAAAASNNFDGAIYLFERDGTGWSQTASFFGGTPEIPTLLGRLDFDGQTLVLGASNDGAGFLAGSGAVYVFQRQGAGWSDPIRLRSPFPLRQAQFGRNVAVDGNLMAAGSDKDMSLGRGDGAVFIFGRATSSSSWKFIQSLFPSSAFGRRFGISLELEGNAVVVGEDFGPGLGSSPGAAYIYEISDNRLPQAHADVVRRIECSSPDGAEVLLDGSMSTDADSSPGTNDDIRRFEWAENFRVFRSEVLLGDGEILKTTVPFLSHRITLSVTDRSFMTDQDEITVEVTDSAPPTGGVVSPPAGACLGAADLPVVLEDGFRDRCDAELVRSYGEPTGVVRVSAADLTSLDEQGFAVAADRDRLVVGAPGDDYRGGQSGSVYVFRRDGNAWIHEQKINPADIAAFYGFGNAVAIEGETLVAGASNNVEGTAYVFEFQRDRWVEVAKLLPPDDGTFVDFFGESVALSGDVLVVGTGEGESAHVFRRGPEGWAYEQKLETDEPVFNFGQAVAIFDDTIVIGVNRDSTAGPAVGSAFVYRYDGGAWVFQERIRPEPAEEFAEFGTAVAIQRNRIVVGAPQAAVGSPVTGRIYVFEQQDDGSWQQTDRLLADDGPTRNAFGNSVSISGDTILVGARNDSTIGQRSGAAYVFRYVDGEWRQEPKLLLENGRSFDAFGTAVSAGGRYAVIGAPGDDSVENNAGAIYVYDLSSVSAGAASPQLAPDLAPVVTEHGLHRIAVRAQDNFGRGAFDAFKFTVDLVDPVVGLTEIAAEAAGGGALPRRFLLEAGDDDGAPGGVVRETISVDGCVVDGALLEDLGSPEMRVLRVDEATLCEVLAFCGLDGLVDPVLSVEVEDCAGNTAQASQVVEGSFSAVGCVE